MAHIIKKGLLFFCFCALATVSIAQNTEIPIGSKTYTILERLAIKTGLPALQHAAVRPFTRKDISNFAMALDSIEINWSKQDERDIQYLFNENNEWLSPAAFTQTLTAKKEVVYEKVYVDSSQIFYTIKSTITPKDEENIRYQTRKKPILKYFYKTPANLFEINKPSFYLRVNPILHTKVAKSKNEEELLFANQRGIEIRGGIDGRVFFIPMCWRAKGAFPIMSTLE